MPTISRRLSRGPDGSPLTTAAPATHHFTPSSIVIDALGRPVLAVARSREAADDPSGPLPAIQELHTATTYDIRGNVLTVTDPLKRVAFSYEYDLADRPWRIESLDGGVRRIVLDVVDAEVERRDSKGALTLQSYDRLQRPSRVWARDDAASRITLRQRLEYGDAGTPDQPGPDRERMRARNLLGQLNRHLDEAGLTAVSSVDFKGNVLEKFRQVIADEPILTVFEQAGANGWRVSPFQVDWDTRPGQTLAERERELLEAPGYRMTSNYDALSRVTRLQLPDDVEGTRRELRPEYDRGANLARLSLDDTVYIERIAYDAKRPARAHRLRQRRPDPVCVPSADLQAGTAAQRAVCQAGRYQLPPDRRGAAGLRLRPRPRRPPPRDPRSDAWQRHPQQPRGRDDDGSGARAAAGIGRRAQSTLRVRPALSSARRHGP